MRAERQGRSLYDAVNLDATEALIGYLALDVGRARPADGIRLGPRPLAHHAIRVLRLNASPTDCVFEVERPTTVEEVNANAAGRLTGTLLSGLSNQACGLPFCPATAGLMVLGSWLSARRLVVVA